MTLTTEPKTMMQAALFYAPGDVRYEVAAMPVPGAGELVVRIQTALTCGTDLKTYRRGHPVLLKHFPSPFGHEGAGVVSAVGEGVTGFQLGDRVVAANSAPCMVCFFCRKGQVNLCEYLDLLNGTYAQYLKVPAPIVSRNTLTIPEHVSFEAAAFAEPLAVSLRGIEACRIQPGDSVAVIGLGAIGQFLVKLAKLQGAHVVAMGRNTLKREMAHTFAKADVVLDITKHPDPQALVAEFTPGGYGFDVVIEAVGLPRMWEMALQLVRKGGLVNLFGGCERGTTISLDTRRMHYDELTLISLFHHTPEYFRKALDWISQGQLDPTPLITHTMPLSQLVEALEKVSSGQALKVAIKPDAI